VGGGRRKNQSKPRPVWDWAVVMTQGLLFHSANNGPLKVLPLAHTTISRMATVFGKSESTIERCLKNSIKMSLELRTKVQEYAKINNFEFTNQKRYEAINPDFLTGKKDRYGIPEVNEALILQMRRDRMSIRNIKRISGISKPRISNILKRNNVSTHNLQTQTDAKGLSLRQRNAIKAHNRRINKAELKQKNSLVRKGLATILKEYKSKQTPIERQIDQHGIAKWQAWQYLKNSFAYNILKRRIVRKYSRQKERHEEKRKSKLYRYEKDMYPSVEKYLLSLYPGLQVRKEVCISKTSNRGREGFTTDFYVCEKNLCIEVKQRTTTCSNKVLYGQIFVYKSKGHKCAALFPHDVYIPPDLTETLTAHGVEIMVMPCP
jgi:hypothetical protein